MRQGEPAVVPDISTDERIPLAAYRSTFVRSLVTVPVGEPAAAAIGAYWATEASHADAVPALVELADLVGARLDGIGLADAPWAPNFKIRSTTRGSTLAEPTRRVRAARAAARLTV